MSKEMRNKGLHHLRLERLDLNALEIRYARAWERENKDSIQRGLLELLLTDGVSDRDREVAATLIQWLGSDVGQDFVRRVLRKKKKE